MDPESKAQLEEALSLAKENNIMLKTLKRSLLWSRAWHVLYWVIIIGSTVGAYYYIQPYLEKLIGVYSGAQQNLDSVNSILNSFKK